MVAEHDGLVLDFSRQRATAATLPLLLALARRAALPEKLEQMRSGSKALNPTEGRAVLHAALRAPRRAAGAEPGGAPPLIVDGRDVHADVHATLDAVRAFSERVRSGAHRGATGRPLTDVVSIGIGGSYLGVEFVYEALRKSPAGAAGAEGRRLRFLANVDPVDVARALEGLSPETTLVLVVSKTFTTAETMLNARTVRDWLVRGMPSCEAAAVVAQHVAAISTAAPLVAQFGIRAENVFGFWDWVGGRFSASSAVGVAPLALHFSFGVAAEVLRGAHALDEHFFSAPLERNLPALMGLFGVWNATFLGFPARALLPYSQALLRLPAHIQQVSMESNGKRVDAEGNALPYAAGAVEFGEPGTNGQHSFYQLLHQGRVVPADFVGFCESQCPARLEGEAVSNHDELMSNFFAQPDALAVGRSAAEVAAGGATPAALVPHKVFDGNRPSNALLLPRLDAYAAGQLLALFEHRTFVEGALWGICEQSQSQSSRRGRGGVRGRQGGAQPTRAPAARKTPPNFESFTSPPPSPRAATRQAPSTSGEWSSARASPRACARSCRLSAVPPRRAPRRRPSPRASTRARAR
jgi:glucose-6-phosphate isomerase